MARTKNVGGGPGDEDWRPLPRQLVDPKGKATKKLATQKHKYPDTETARAAVVAEAADCAERGGARSGVVIADPLPPGAMEGIERVECLHGGPPGTIMVARRCHVIDEVLPQGESQQQPPPVEPQPAQET